MIPSKLLPFSLIISLLVLVAGCSSSSTSILPAAITGSPSGFEGVVIMKMSFGGTDNKQTYQIKGNLQRSDFSMSLMGKNYTTVTIIDTKDGTVTSLNPENKTYTVFNGKDFAGKMDTSKIQMPKIEKTGKKETIAGIECEHFLLMGEPSKPESKMDMCIAQNFLTPGGASNFFKDMVIPDEMKNGGGFPLKMSTTNAGKTTTIMEVTSLERKSVADSVFTVPSDYKKVDAPQIPSGLLKQ